MRFSQVNAMRIPKGSVSKIRQGDKVLWDKVLPDPFLARYVSLGDSIAAGYEIDSGWATNYGRGSEYGENGNTETAIVPNTYTDLIDKELKSRHGDKVLTTSFAHSGDQVNHLMAKLDHDVVRNAIAKADYVTICIGANDVLTPALDYIQTYINTGDLDTLTNIVNANIATLNGDGANSYRALFDKMNGINPNAKYAFTTVYNPYRFLWLEDGVDGFFKPMLDTIPQMTILGFEIDWHIKNYILSTPMVRTLFTRVNDINWWAEMNVNKLNIVLNDKISEYQAVNPNFSIAYTKSLFESFPDRPISAEYHYNDLVNVEYTKGYDTAQMNWSALWNSEGKTREDFWSDLASKHTSLSGFDSVGFANELIPLVVDRVIMPDIDPHPETYGHYVLKRAFADALNLQALDYYSVSYDANGGSGAMETQVIPTIDGLPAFITLRPNAFTHPEEGYRIVGWNSEPDGSGYSYSPDMYVGIVGVNTLYAQWSNMYTVRYRHSNHTNLYDADNTGRQGSYSLWIDGAEMRKLGTFATDTGDTYTLPYNAHVIAVVNDYYEGVAYEHHDARIYYNGEQVAVGRPASYEMRVRSDLDIDFRWLIAGSLPTFDAQSWWDCHITTM